MLKDKVNIQIIISTSKLQFKYHSYPSCWFTSTLQSPLHAAQCTLSSAKISQPAAVFKDDFPVEYENHITHIYSFMSSSSRISSMYNRWPSYHKSCMVSHVASSQIVIHIVVQTSEQISFIFSSFFFWDCTATAHTNKQIFSLLLKYLTVGS